LSPAGIIDVEYYSTMGYGFSLSAGVMNNSDADPPGGSSGNVQSLQVSFQNLALKNKKKKVPLRATINLVKQKKKKGDTNCL